MEDRLINKITNRTIVFIALAAIPINAVVFFALQSSEFVFPRIFPVFMGVVAILLAFFRNRIKYLYKIRILTGIFFLIGLYNLSIRLLDIASLWFILFIVYTLFASKRKMALHAFWISSTAILLAGIGMMTEFLPIPINYNFNNCQFACVAVRLLHFLLIGYVIYYILNEFFSTILKNMRELKEKSEEQEQLNRKLQKEIKTRKTLQQEMIDAVVKTEEKERKRIASDLHDGLGPLISAINLYFQAYIDAPENDKENIGNKLQDIIQQSGTDVSRISHNISPLILQNYGLKKAIETFTNDIKAAHDITFNLDLNIDVRFDMTRELTIYRTITELINNTIKHGGASTINISVNLENQRITVCYSDNGKGFSPEESPKYQNGLGLVSIRNRILSLEGTIEINSSPMQGMKVKIKMPVK